MNILRKFNTIHLDRRLATILMMCLLYVGTLSSQSIQLANQYFDEGEYDKAAVIFKDLYAKNKNTDYYLSRLVLCYKSMGEPGQARQLLENAIKETPNNPRLYVNYSDLLRENGEIQKADEQLNKIINILPADKFKIIDASVLLQNLNKMDMALAVLLKGETLLGSGSFSMDLANLYGRMGNRQKMLYYYLDVLKTDPLMYQNITSMVQRTFTSDTEYDDLQQAIYEKLGTDPGNAQLIQLLSWIFIQKKDFKSALRQLKALRSTDDNDNGRRIVELAAVAYNEGQYNVAAEAYKYIIDLGRSSPYFNTAYDQYFNALIKGKLDRGDLTTGEIQEMDTLFTGFLNEYGRSGQTAKVMQTYASYLVLYKNDLKGAIKVLTDYVEVIGVNPRDMAAIKLDLGNYLLMTGERWDASLLYSQVDKDFKEDPLGQEARYRNALLSYYAGDFSWAQTQFDVLKNSTSRPISNDAIDRSVFIMDNMGLDSTDVAMKLYASAELLIYRNQFELALQKLDTLTKQFPEHALDDDVIYAKAHIYVKKRQFDEAIAAYTKVFTDYKDEIRADNALYELAKLYDETLLQPEKAQPLYEKLFTEYPGSILAFDARIRFRQLRGDKVQ
ncbi:MAG TPA: tetratricopeptide repeat protein [Saprospiraceae bacterium]|nr:tetratricopeptide repeat protein [Saprospiraceae bacterium]